MNKKKPLPKIKKNAKAFAFLKNPILLIFTTLVLVLGLGLGLFFLKTPKKSIEVSESYKSNSYTKSGHSTTNLTNKDKSKDTPNLNTHLNTNQKFSSTNSIIPESTLSSFTENQKIQDDILNLLEMSKHGNEKEITQISHQLKILEEERKTLGLELAQAKYSLKDQKSQRELKNLAGIIYLKSPKNGNYLPTPLIRVTHDINASISSESLNLDILEAITNYSFKVGVWDQGATRTTHQEIRGRSRQVDSANLNEHATRVSGVIASIGVTNTAKSISSLVSIDCYDWNNDLSELTSNATSTNITSANIPISNHSYNFSAGWYLSSGVWIFLGHYTMGQYNSGVGEVDALLHSRPYLTMVRSAGNDRTENPKNGETAKIDFWATETVPYNSAIHPLGDGNHKGGFDTISYAALAKNTITVGAVNDAVTSGTRDLAKATLTTYTSWGPADDGRIKPDIVANGSSLVSPASTSDTAYSSLSGTSAAAPVVSSIAALLTQYWINTRGTLTPTISGLKSSTLKALLIHGADDLGNPGPDYKFGWGLANGKKSLDIIKNNNIKPQDKILQELQFQSPHEQEFYWDKSSEIVATICWTDPRGSNSFIEDSNVPSLVNDLDIIIIDPNGNQHLPFVMPFTTARTLASMNSPATRGVNSVDNVEMIRINNPVSGKYRVIVTSKTNINANSPQEYCLIITGTQKSNPDPDPEAGSYETWATNAFGNNWQSLPLTDTTSDFDNDGLNNWAEFDLNTNPRDPESGLKLEIVSIVSPAKPTNSPNSTNPADTNTTSLKNITLRVGPLPKAGTLEIISTPNLESQDWNGPRISVPILNQTDQGQNIPLNPVYTDVTISSEESQLFFRLQYTGPTIQ